MNGRRALMSLVLSAAMVFALAISAPASATATGRGATTLDLNTRLSAQRAIESTYWKYREWPSQNPRAKPALEQVVPLSVVRDKVQTTLRLTNALRNYWNRSVSGADLQAEMDREARGTRQPQMLKDLWAGLGNDPALVAETLARSILVDRLARDLQANDPRFHAQSFEDWWEKVGPVQDTAIVAPAYEYHLLSLAPAALGSWTPTYALPEADLLTSAVWTGAEMIIWGGTEVGGSTFNSGSRYDPATDTWRTTSGVNAPFPRKQHTAVWTGTEMIVWGGCGLGSEHSCQIFSGGRYNPVTDTWAATSIAGAPAPRINHTAVWTGTQMIVWGGCTFVNDACTPTALGNGGGRYDPAANSWQPTSTTGAPEARQARAPRPPPRSRGQTLGTRGTS